MARRLRQAGHAVGLVALFDADAPRIKARSGDAGRSRRPLARVGARLRTEYKNLAGLSPRDRVAYARATLEHAVHRLATLGGRRLTSEEDPLVRKVAEAQSLAARAYRPAPYDGTVVLYKAQHRLTRHFVDPWFGWKALVGEGIEVRLIPSAGGSIIQDPDGAAVVAGDLRHRIPPS